MKKIEKMTVKQKNQVPVYLKKWMDNGLNTAPITLETAVSECKWLYSTFLKDHFPEPIVFLATSPLQGQIIANELKAMSKNPPQELGSQLGSQLYSQLDSQLRSQLYSQLYSQLDSQLGSQKLEYFYGQNPAWWWGGYYGFYDFILDVLLPKNKSEFELFTRMKQFTHSMNWIIPLHGVCIAVQRPSEIHWGEADATGIKRLHNFSGPAVKYADGYSLYKFNGVTVTKELTEKKSQSFTKEDIFKEVNADIRREIIRKVGLERSMDLLEAKVIDKMDDYELLSFDIGDKRGRPYLKMKNPSLALTHIEGVPAGIKTVKAALAWRNGLQEYTAPITLT